MGAERQRRATHRWSADRSAIGPSQSEASIISPCSSTSTGRSPPVSEYSLGPADNSIRFTLGMHNHELGRGEAALEAFRQAAIPLHNDASAGAGWSKAEYDALQALK